MFSEIARSYREFSEQGFEPVRQQWWELSVLQPGELVEVECGNERYAARVRELSASGQLVVESGDGRIKELAAEDVTLRIT